jgi:PIN domain nuclease of toxin-antitoxin system
MGGTGPTSRRGETSDLAAFPAIGRLIETALVLRRPISLDSPALIAYVSDFQPIASLVAPIVEHPYLDVTISAVVLAETLTPPTSGLAASAESGSEHKTIEKIRSFVIALPRVTIVDFDQAVAVEVAIVRSQTKLKLPDAAAIATARLTRAVAILGNDRRWKNKPLGVPYLHLDDLVVRG